MAAAAVALQALVAPGAHADIRLELRFDGQAFEPKAPPDFSCFHGTLGRWVSRRALKREPPGVWVLERPGNTGCTSASTRTRLILDATRATMRRRYSSRSPDAGPERLTVDLPRLIHLTGPGDNGRSLEGMLTGCATQPTFETPRFSWAPVATVDFAWEPIVSGAEYRVSLAIVSCGPAHAPRAVVRRTTEATTAAFTLPPSANDEYYLFRVEAWKKRTLAHFERERAPAGSDPRR